MGVPARSGQRMLVTVVALVAVIASMTVGVVAETTKPSLYRIFLEEGEALVTVGDYARVGDHVVFSLPLNLEPESLRAHLVTIPAAAVDWLTTERYADAVRAASYAATRGELDFAQMSADVARVLNEIAFTNDDQRRASLARATKQRLLSWSDTHYGYRAADIVEIVSLLDAAMDSGSPRETEDSLRLSFVVTTEGAPPVPLLPRPTLRELVGRALTVSGLTPVPAERISLLRAAVEILEGSDDALDAEWRDQTLTGAEADLEAELRVDDTYANLRRTALTNAAAYAAKADVRGVQSVLEALRERDAELGHKRPDHFAALIESLETRLEEARALRLERDQKQLHAAAVRAYEQDVAGVIDDFEAQRGLLDDIRLLAGPAAGDLPELSTQFSEFVSRLGGVSPPAEMEGLHHLIHQALTLAGSAARGRYQAVQDADLHEAWDAASAAAGALMLFDRATKELEQALVR